MNERFQVVFDGEYADDADPLTVVDRLAEAFQLSRLRVLALIGRPPAVIHKGLDSIAAAQEVQVLAGLGLFTRVEPQPLRAAPWDGVERRLGERRASYDRRLDGRPQPATPRRRHPGRRQTDIAV